MAGNAFFKGVSGHLSVLMNCSGVIMKKFPISTQSFDRQGRLEKAALEEFISGKYQIWNYRDPRMFCVTLEDALYTDSENGLTNGCYHQGG